jgi:hypothetical protein
MEGTQFYGLFGMVLSLYRQNKFPGIGQMFRYTLRDESNHIELFRNLFMDLIEENREIWTAEFKEELRPMAEAHPLEKEFIRDCLPVNAVGLSHRRIPDLHRLHRRPAPRRLRPGPAEPRREEPAALARRDDGHQEGAELLRGSRHRISKILLAPRFERRRTLKSLRPFLFPSRFLPPNQAASAYASALFHFTPTPPFAHEAILPSRTILPSSAPSHTPD